MVLEDADLDIASSCGAWGSFLHQGQICMQTGRHLVHRSVADEYIERLAARAGNLACGNPAQEQAHLGPLINEAQAKRVEDIVNRSVEMGARIVVGGKRNGNYYEATVMSDVTPDMPVFSEEVFGPVAPVMTFDSDDNACSLVNESLYGLAAAIHSRSTERALQIACFTCVAGLSHSYHGVITGTCELVFNLIRKRLALALRSIFILSIGL